MELVIAAAAVATGFSGYLCSLIKTLDNATPYPRLTAWNGSGTIQSGGLTIDLIAFGAVLIITLLLVLGVHQVGARVFEWACE